MLTYLFLAIRGLGAAEYQAWVNVHPLSSQVHKWPAVFRHLQLYVACGRKIDLGINLLAC